MQLATAIITKVEKVPCIGKKALCIPYSSSNKQQNCGQTLLGVDHDAISTTFGNICFRSSEALPAPQKGGRTADADVIRNQVDWGEHQLDPLVVTNMAFENEHLQWIYPLDPIRNYDVP